MQPLNHGSDCCFKKKLRLVPAKQHSPLSGRKELLLLYNCPNLGSID